MNNKKDITLRIISRQKKMLEIISRSIKDNIMTSALIMGLMGLPMFSSFAIESEMENGGTMASNRFKQNNQVSIPQTKNFIFQTIKPKQNTQIVMPKSEHSIFQPIKHKVIGIDLGTKYVVSTVGYDNGSGALFNLVENVYSEKKSPLLIPAQAPEDIFLNAKKADLTGVSGLRSTAEIPALIKNYREASTKIKGKPRLQPVSDFNGYLTQVEYQKGKNIIVPIQDMVTPINLENLTPYNQQQIFGIILQGKQHFANEYGSKESFESVGQKHKFDSDGKTVDLNLTLPDNVPEENQRIIAAIYAEIYAEEFGLDLDRINVSYMNESDSTMVTYLYENYSANKTLKNRVNHDKIVILNLGQSGLRMKGLNGTDESIQLTKSMCYDNISGDLIDQAIWKVWADKIKEVSGINPNTLNMSQKSKCLAELNKVKEKLSADGADTISASIEIGDDDVEFTFSVEELKQALNADNLIKIFKNDIRKGVAEMFSGNQDMKEIQFVIVGGSLRIPSLQNALEGEGGLTSKTLIKTLNMDEAPAYGAGYIALLLNKYKNALSRKVDVQQILNDINFEFQYKPVLDDLWKASQDKKKTLVLRNAIEATCYEVNRIIETQLSDLNQQIENKKKNLANSNNTEIKKKQNEISQLQSLKLTSEKIFTIIRDNNGKLHNNLEFMNNLNDRFNNLVGNINSRNLPLLLKDLNNFIENQERSDVDSHETLLKALDKERENLMGIKHKTLVFHKNTFINFNKVMNDSIKHFKKTKDNKPNLPFVHKILPVLNELVELVAKTAKEKGIDRAELIYNESDIMDLLIGIRSSIIQILKDYKQGKQEFFVLRRNFIKGLKQYFNFIDENYDSQLLEDKTFTRELGRIRDKLARTLNINNL